MERLRIVLCGGSVLLGTLEASLRRLPDLELITAAPSAGGPETLAGLAPDVILFDLGAAAPQPAFTLLQSCPHLRLIGLDADRNRVTVWSARQLDELSLSDLVRVLTDSRNPPEAALIPKDLTP